MLQFLFLIRTKKDLVDIMLYYKAMTLHPLRVVILIGKMAHLKRIN